MVEEKTGGNPGFFFKSGPLAWFSAWWGVLSTQQIQLTPAQGWYIIRVC